MKIEPGHFNEPVPGVEELDFAFLLMAWQLEAAIRVHENTSLLIKAPLRLNIVEGAYRDEAGNEVGGQVWDPELRSRQNNLHHPRENTQLGLGDAVVGLWTRVLGAGEPGAAGSSGARKAPSRFALDLRVGVSLPTGGVEPSPWGVDDQYADQPVGQAGGQIVKHAFYGSGTFDPQIGVQGLWDAGSWGASIWASARAALYQNPVGYQEGVSASLGAAVESGFGLEKLRFTAMGDLRYHAASRWGSEEALNTGRTDILLGVGLRWYPFPSWGVMALIRAPVYSEKSGDQVDWPLVTTLGLQYVWN